MATTGGGVPELTPAQLCQMMDTGEPLVILDVREPYEWEISNLGAHGAKLIPMSELPQRLNELDPADAVVVYCRTGARSDRVARFMLAKGFSRVWNLAGGINEWAREIEPDMPVY